LAIGLKTAHTHKLTAYRKLGCRSTIEMVKFAIRVGLIKAD
jgi:DNA-binding CsgD family transcriptional regulator